MGFCSCGGRIRARPEGTLCSAKNVDREHGRILAAFQEVDKVRSQRKSVFTNAEDVVEDVDKVAATTACLFFGYFDGATTISESCGGGGGNNELPKKKDNEDELFFALRCHQMAKTMHAPKYRLRR